LDLIADGRTNRQIATQMILAEKTVKNYITSLLAKLQMTSRTEAAVYAARHEGKSEALEPPTPGPFPS
jgi:DNA-binding NarL/FixJ family response regulator